MLSLNFSGYELQIYLRKIDFDTMGAYTIFPIIP